MTPERFHSTGDLVRIDAAHEQIREQVTTALARNAFFCGRNLQIEFENNELVLRGVVSSYYMKQLAQETMRQIEGVQSVRNELEVIAR